MRSRRQRSFPLKSLLIFLAILSLILIEPSFHILQRIVASYLIAINRYRPQSGSYWHRRSADFKVSENFLDIRLEQGRKSRLATLAESFYDLYTIADSTAGLSLPVEKFMELYRRLPPDKAERIISPLDLLELIYEHSLQKCQVFRKGNQLRLVFIGLNDQPLWFTMIPDIFELAGGEPAAAVTAKGSILEESEFYLLSPADFFRAFDRLKPAIKLQIINNPFKLLNASGRLVRVGIAKNCSSGVCRVVFERLDKLGRVHPMVFQARKVAVEYLLDSLENIFGQEMFPENPQ